MEGVEEKEKFSKIWGSLEVTNIRELWPFPWVHSAEVIRQEKGMAAQYTPGARLPTPQCFLRGKVVWRLGATS